MVVRPSISRAASKKKRKPASRLSFGVRADDDDDDTGAADTAPVFATPKKKSEGSSLKKAISLKDLTMRSREDDDRPRYNKEYLEELQSSTPNTPARADTSAPEAEDEMNLDASELEGAMIVEDPSSAPTQQQATSTSTRILTDAEIQEKKERRARLAHEEDFIALSDDDDEGLFKKKKDGGRLERDDENMYEGFEDFVEDEGVALGRKAEREARKKKRAEIASLIREAEGNTDEESDESDAERRVAFEAAQSRAGMDGLKRPSAAKDAGEAAPKPKIAPLPSMTACLRALQETLAARKGELEAKSRKVAELRSEREEIRKREAEVQRLVDEAGEKYKAAVAGAGALEGAPAAGAGGASPTVEGFAKDSAEFAAERGLESLGTPTVKRDEEDLAA